MDSLQSKSGTWRCRWEQFDESGVEQLQMSFCDGWAAGKGRDPQGSFAYAGEYTLDGSRVLLNKTYTGALVAVPASITYHGVWDGALIAGEWIDDMVPTNRGPFEMWPIDGELDLGDAVSAHAESTLSGVR